MPLLTKEKKRIFWLTFALVVISWISLKIVLPALPSLPAIFQCADSGVKLSVSLYLLFFALTQPFWGGMIQRYGSRNSMFLGLLIAASGSLIVFFSKSLIFYIIGRSLEGFGYGAASPVGRTWLTKYFEKKELASFIGIISGVAAAMPAVGPIIGGYLTVHIDWRAIFILLFLLTVSFLYAMHRWLPRERNDQETDTTVHLSGLVKIYSSIISSRRFWGYTFPYACLLGGLLGYYSAMPYWFHTQLGISQHTFSYLAIPTVSLYIIGLLSVGRIVKKYDIDNILISGLLLFLFVVMAAIILAFMHLNGVYIIVLIMSGTGFATGLVVPTANAGVLSYFRNIAAPASAMVGVVIFSFSSLTSWITMNLQIRESIWPLVIYISSLSLLSLVTGYTGLRLSGRTVKVQA